MEAYQGYIVKHGYSSSFVPNEGRLIAPLRTRADHHHTLIMKDIFDELLMVDFAQIDNIISRQNVRLDVSKLHLNHRGTVQYRFDAREVATITLLTLQRPKRAMYNGFSTSSPELSAKGLEIFETAQMCAENRWFLSSNDEIGVKLCNAIGIKMNHIGTSGQENIYVPTMMDQTIITADEPVQNDQNPFWHLTRRIVLGEQEIILSGHDLYEARPYEYRDQVMSKYIVVGEPRSDRVKRYAIDVGLEEFTVSNTIKQSYGWFFHDFRNIDVNTMTCEVAFRNMAPGVKWLSSRTLYGFDDDHVAPRVAGGQAVIQPVSEPAAFELPSRFACVFENVTGHTIEQARRNAVVYRTFVELDDRLLFLTWRKYRLRTVYLEAQIVADVSNGGLVLGYGAPTLAKSDPQIFNSNDYVTAEELEELPIVGVYEAATCMESGATSRLLDSTTYLLYRDPAFFQKFLIYAATLGAISDNDLPVKLRNADDEMRRRYAEALYVRIYRGAIRDFILMNLWA